MTNLDLQFSEKTSFKRIADKGPLNTNSPIWTELLCSSFFLLSLLSKSCDSCFLCSMLAFAVFFLPSSHFQIELAHWPDPEGQLSSNSQRFCYAPTRFKVWRSDVMPSFLISLVCMICIFLSLLSMAIHDDLSAILGVKIKCCIGCSCSGQFKSEHKWSSNKNKKWYLTFQEIEEIFQYKGKKSISPRVRNPFKEWRDKTHEKKLKERYLSHCYVFNLFKLSRYFWLHFLLYALSWPQAASLPRTPSIQDETIHELSWQGLCSSSLQKLGFEQILASLSSFNHKCCWCASKWINSMFRYRR